MKVNLFHYKNDEIKYANGLYQIPEMMDARQFYISGMKDRSHYGNFLDVAKSMDAQNTGRNNRSNTTAGQVRQNSLKKTKRIDRYGNQIEGAFPKIREQQPLERQLGAQEYNHEIMKFYNTPFTPPKQNHVTQSSHYKYNRMRQGGWGKRGPLINENDLPFIAKNTKLNLTGVGFRREITEDSLDMSLYHQQKKKATAQRASVMSTTQDKSVFECVDENNNSLRNSML